MPRGHLQFGHSWERAEHREADAIAGGAQHLVVAFAADAVQNHAAEPDSAVEGREAVQQGGQALTVPARVDDQYHRRTEQSGDLRGGSFGDRGRVVFIDAAVEQPHHPFDHREVTSEGAVPIQRHHAFRADQHRIEVASGTSCRQPVVSGIDVIGPHLERRDPMPGPPQRTDQPGRDRRLPASRGRSGDHHRGHAGHQRPHPKPATAGGPSRVPRPSHTTPAAPKNRRLSASETEPLRAQRIPRTDTTSAPAPAAPPRAARSPRGN